MPYPSEALPVKAGRLGLIFPVHIWGLPLRVIRFVERLQVDPETHFLDLSFQ